MNFSLHLKFRLMLSLIIIGTLFLLRLNNKGTPLLFVQSTAIGHVIGSHVTCGVCIIIM